MDIGTRISYFRNAKQYSVNRLATLAGISQSYLRDVELGKKNPTVEVLSYICDALDLSLRDFFDDTLESRFWPGPAAGPDLPDEPGAAERTSSVFKFHGTLTDF